MSRYFTPKAGGVSRLMKTDVCLSRWSASEFCLWPDTLLDRQDGESVKQSREEGGMGGYREYLQKLKSVK